MTAIAFPGSSGQEADCPFVIKYIKDGMLEIKTSGVLLATLAVELWNFDVPRPSGIHYRNNIVRTSQWNAWPLAIAAGAAWSIVAARGWPDGRYARKVSIVLAAGFLLSCLLVPIGAVQRSGEGAASHDSLAHLHPADRAAIGFARRDLDPRRHVVVEGACFAACTAAGGMNLVSAASGVPAAVGWAGHAGHWHGAAAVEGRREAVARLFADPSSGAARSALRGLGATHVWIGPWEEFVYGPGVRRRFRDWPVAFEDGERALLEWPGPIAGTPDGRSAPGRRDRGKNCGFAPRRIRNTSPSVQSQISSRLERLNRRRWSKSP